MSDYQPRQPEPTMLDRVRSSTTARAVGLVGAAALGVGILSAGTIDKKSPDSIEILCSGHHAYPVNPGDSFEKVMDQVSDDIAERTGITPASMFVNASLYDALKKRGLSWERKMPNSRLSFEVPEGVTVIDGPEKCDPEPAK